MSQQKPKKSPSRKYHNVTSLKNFSIFEKKNLTENNNSSNNWKSSKVSKSVTENMSVLKFLQPPIPVWRGACILYFKIIVPIFCCPFFSENYLNSQVIMNRLVNKHTGEYHPSPSQLTLRILPLMFLRTPKRFAFPESFLNFFPKPAYFTMVAEKFQIYGVKITGKYICESKNWICSFLLMPPSKTLPRVYIIPSQTEEIIHSSQTEFSEDLHFSWQKGGDGLWSWKN